MRPYFLLYITIKLTSGTNGGSIIPASSRFQFIFLNNGCDFTSLELLFLQLNRCLGSLCNNYKKRFVNICDQSCQKGSHETTQLYKFMHFKTKFVNDI